MFRIVCDPSSGSTELCLTEITLSGSQIFFVCLFGVWQRNFELAVCVHCSPLSTGILYGRLQRVTIPEAVIIPRFSGTNK